MLVLDLGIEMHVHGMEGGSQKRLLFAEEPYAVKPIVHLDALVCPFIRGRIWKERRRLEQEGWKAKWTGLGC